MNPEDLILQIKTRVAGWSNPPQWLLDDLDTLLSLVTGTTPVGVGPNVPTGAAYNSESVDSSQGDYSLAPGVRAIYVGRPGNVEVQLVDDSISIYENVVSGTVLALQAKTILSQGTTAGALVALR